MNGTGTATPAGSVAGALLAAAFVLLLLVALMDPAGTVASTGTGVVDPGHSRQLGCSGDSVAPDSSERANAVSCTR